MGGGGSGSGVGDGGQAWSGGGGEQAPLLSGMLRELVNDMLLSSRLILGLSQ